MEKKRPETFEHQENNRNTWKTSENLWPTCKTRGKLEKQLKTFDQHEKQEKTWKKKNNWKPWANMKNNRTPRKTIENLWKHGNQPLATEVSRETADQSLKQRDNMEIFWNQPKTADQFQKWLKTFETHEKIPKQLTNF